MEEKEDEFEDFFKLLIINESLSDEDKERMLEILDNLSHR